ncbi:T1 [Tupaiid betaherpesvirus 1]|uniref:T1 n=1 Tax=Tupaiid herpesvirus 1 (strain 1) TaxID=10397 RepID=Q91TW2_TUHV1|nr:T1 [Tupaiid betaherpesvirus 1]AAK57025.1 T1 [Tupaiid betaherpesvirus 1]
MPLTHSFAQYESLVRAFGFLYMSHYSAKATRRCVQRCAGRCVSLQSPPGWSVLVTPRGLLPQLAGLDLTALCPGKESWTAVVGPVVYASPRAPRAHETPYFLLLGHGFRVFIFDLSTTTMHLAARDFEEFARQGVRAALCLYEPAFVPLLTTSPSELVRPLLSASTSFAELRDLCIARRGQTVRLETPGRERASLRLVGHWEPLRACRPFSEQSPWVLQRCVEFVTRRLCCAWFVLGTVSHPEGDPAQPTQVLVVDQACAVYTYRLCDGELFRLAESVGHLFRAGVLAALLGRRHAGRGPGAEGRLEEPLERGYWFKERPGADDVFTAVADANDRAAQLVWLGTRERFLAPPSESPWRDPLRQALALDDWTWRAPCEAASGELFADHDQTDYLNGPPVSYHAAVNVRTEKARRQGSRALLRPLPQPCARCRSTCSGHTAVAATKAALSAAAAAAAGEAPAAAAAKAKPGAAVAAAAVTAVAAVAAGPEPAVAEEVGEDEEAAAVEGDAGPGEGWVGTL